MLNQPLSISKGKAGADVEDRRDWGIPAMRLALSEVLNLTGCVVLMQLHYSILNRLLAGDKYSQMS